MITEQYAEKKYEAGNPFGRFSEIEGYRTKLDQSKLNKLALRIIDDSSHYFRTVSSFQNPQRRILRDDSFKFAVPFSGGHDSGITLELLARAYEDRIKEGNQCDEDDVIAYSCKFGLNQPDNTFNREYVQSLQRRYPNLPLTHRVVDIGDLNCKISSGLERILGGDAAGYPWFTPVILGSLVSEHSNYLGIDSSNLTESLLAEISNGCIGLNPLSPLGTIPKSVLFGVSDQLGITEHLPCADSLLPRDKTKASKYFSGSPSTIRGLKDSFATIDTTIITYLENPHLNSEEISSVTEIPLDITEEVIDRVEVASKTQSPFYMGGKDDLTTEMETRKSREWRRGFYEGSYKTSLVEIFNRGER